MVMSTSIRDTESVSMSALSVFLIVPDNERRHAIAKALSGTQAHIGGELAAYPRMDDLAQISGADYDVIVVDLDPDPEAALDVVENVCAANAAVTVMIYAAHASSEMLVRCMRAGAREFLSEPLQPGAVAEALVRASVRREEVGRTKKTAGKLFVFAGAKGGCGVTTLATNFALSLAKEAGKVLLVDLDLHLGDAALSLGVASKFSAADALEKLEPPGFGLFIRHACETSGRPFRSRGGRCRVERAPDKRCCGAAAASGAGRFRLRGCGCRGKARRSLRDAL